MRIVGGRWKGRPLTAPQGRDVTRPTTDRTREQVASMVLSAFGLDLSDVSVLDAFAGSGAMGLELLSRGARACTFIDADRRALALVKQNAQSLGASPDTYAVIGGDAFKLARKPTLPHAPFSLVVLDPPYATPAREVSKLVECLEENGCLAPDACILYERSSHADQLSLKHAHLVKTKSASTIALDLLLFGGSDEQ